MGFFKDLGTEENSSNGLGIQKKASNDNEVMDNASVQDLVAQLLGGGAAATGGNSAPSSDASVNIKADDLFEENNTVNDNLFTGSNETSFETKSSSPADLLKNSDPNKNLSADDIASLFAAFGNNDTSAPAAEPVAEPVKQEPVKAAPEQSAADLLKNSDPNKNLSADDIASLFAAFGNNDTPAPAAEPVAEPVKQEPVKAAPEQSAADLLKNSDPNKNLSADDIASLFAAFGNNDTPAPAANDNVSDINNAVEDSSDADTGYVNTADIFNTDEFTSADALFDVAEAVGNSADAVAEDNPAVNEIISDLMTDDFIEDKDFDSLEDIPDEVNLKGNITEDDAYTANISAESISGADISAGNNSDADFSFGNISGVDFSVGNESDADISVVNNSDADIFIGNESDADLTDGNITEPDLSAGHFSDDYNSKGIINDDDSSQAAYFNKTISDNGSIKNTVTDSLVYETAVDNSADADSQHQTTDFGSMSDEAAAQTEEVYSKMIQRANAPVTLPEYDETCNTITKGTTINGGMVSDCSLTVLGTVNGDINCSGKLSIFGRVVGNSVAADVYVNTKNVIGSIESLGSIKISLGTIVVGDLKGKTAVIAGAVKGNLDIQGPVIIDSTGIVKGNIKARSIQMNYGAIVEGYCSFDYSGINLDQVFEE